MQTIDHLNQFYGEKVVRLAVESGAKEDWNVKSEYKSPNYLTNIEEILKIKI